MPKGAVFLIDEPFKGTAEEDAVPLIIGLIKYFNDKIEYYGKTSIKTSHN